MRTSKRRAADPVRTCWSARSKVRNQPRTPIHVRKLRQGMRGPRTASRGPVPTRHRSQHGTARVDPDGGQVLPELPGRRRRVALALVGLRVRQVARRARGGVQLGVGGLGGHLGRLAAAGLLAIDDPAQAYRALYGLVVRDTQIRVLLGEDPPPAEQILLEARSAVGDFFTLYG